MCTHNYFFLLTKLAARLKLVTNLIVVVVAVVVVSRSNSDVIVIISRVLDTELTFLVLWR